MPLTIAFIPQTAQIELMTGSPGAPDIDPDALPNAIKAIAAHHDVGFVDVSAALRRLQAPERLYYKVDGHLSGEGQPLAAAYLAQQMAADAHGPFAACGRSQSADLGAGP